MVPGLFFRPSAVLWILTAAALLCPALSARQIPAELGRSDRRQLVLSPSQREAVRQRSGADTAVPLPATDVILPAAGPSLAAGTALAEAAEEVREPRLLAPHVPDMPQTQPEPQSPPKSLPEQRGLGEPASPALDGGAFPPTLAGAHNGFGEVKAEPSLSTAPGQEGSVEPKPAEPALLAASRLDGPPTEPATPSAPAAPSMPAPARAAAAQDQPVPPAPSAATQGKTALPALPLAAPGPAKTGISLATHHVAFIAVALLAAGALLAYLPMPTAPVEPNMEEAEVSQVRSWVATLPLLTPQDVESRLPARKGYDCLINQPQVSAGLVRVRGHTVAPQKALQAPLAQRPCLLYSTSATEVRLDGVCAPPVAFDAACCEDFEVELDGPSPNGSAQAQAPLRLRIRGRDVALFGMAGGRQREVALLEEATEHLRAFVARGRRSQGPFAGGAAASLEFSECLLDVGVAVTCVGELRRTETGELLLLPLEPSSDGGDLGKGADAAKGSSPKAPGSAVPAVLLRCLGPFGVRADAAGPQAGRVLISDDPVLFGPLPDSPKESKLYNGRICGLA